MDNCAHLQTLQFCVLAWLLNMPDASPRPCGRPLCRNMQPCADHPTEKHHKFKAWYNSARWKRYSKLFLRMNPFCCFCKARGRIILAVIVDHAKAHRGDYDLFWNEKNHQPLCLKCHNTKSGKEVRRRGDY
jgi:5-methylcytosine-specific restriction protein A